MRKIANSVVRALVKLASLLSIPAKAFGAGHHSLHQTPKQGFAEDREQIQHDWERVGDDMYRSLGSSTTGKKF